MEKYFLFYTYSFRVYVSTYFCNDYICVSFSPETVDLLIELFTLNPEYILYDL